MRAEEVTDKDLTDFALIKLSPVAIIVAAVLGKKKGLQI